MRGLMRGLSLLGLLAVTLAIATMPTASARPEFARRESKACGYCHINPRGGGTRNQMGLRYARNEFSFPATKGNLNSFQRDKDRAAMVRARKMIDIDHTRAAVRELTRLLRSVKKDPSVRKLVADEIHALDVRGTEILGQARRMLRGKDREEGVELLVLLSFEYKDLDVHGEAIADLKELKRDKRLRDLVKKEEREAKARAIYLDAMLQKAEGQAKKAQKTFDKLLKSYPRSRAAEDFKNPPKDKKTEKKKKPG